MWKKKGVDLQHVPSYSASCAVVTVPNRMKAQALEKAWHLASCMRNHLQSAKMANSSPIVFNTPEPNVYICTIVPYYINSVGPKVCDYLLLFFKVVILKT